MITRCTLAAVVAAACLSPTMGWAQGRKNEVRFKPRPADGAAERGPSTVRLLRREPAPPKPPPPKSVAFSHPAAPVPPPPPPPDEPGLTPNPPKSPLAPQPPRPLPEPGPIRRADGPKFYDFRKIRERHRQRPRTAAFDAAPLAVEVGSQPLLIPRDPPAGRIASVPPLNPLPVITDDTIDLPEHGVRSTWDETNAYPNEFLSLLPGQMAPSLMAPQYGYHGEGIGGIPTFTFRPCPKHWGDPWRGYCAEQMKCHCGRCLPWCCDFGRIGSPGSVYVYEHDEPWMHGAPVEEAFPEHPTTDYHSPHAPAPMPPARRLPPRNDLPTPGGR